MAQEIQQLRYIDSEIKGYANWRASTETLAQHQQTINPGEPGSDILARFGQEQIAQLRYVISIMKGVSPANWGQTYTLKQAPMSYLNYNFATGFPDAIDTTYTWSIYIPFGMNTALQSIVKVYLSCTGAGFPVRLVYQYTVIRDGQPGANSGFTL